MPLQKQIVTMPLTGGVDEKSSDKFKQPPAMSSVINGKFSKTGQIEKRPGFKRSLAVTYGPDFIDTATQAATYADEKLVFTGEKAFSLTDSLRWRDKGRITGAEFTDTYGDKSGTNSSSPMATATANGFRVESWSEVEPHIYDPVSIIYHVFTRVIEEATDIVIVPKTKITPPDGMEVAVTYTVNADSAYVAPMVQCVVCNGRIFTLFNGCKLETPSFVASVGSIGTDMYALFFFPTGVNSGIIQGEIITITGTSNYDGDYTVLESDTTNNSLKLDPTPLGNPFETATITLKPVYGQASRYAIYASTVQTQSGPSIALLEPTIFGQFQNNPLSANFTKPVFYVNGAYPVWNVGPAGFGAAPNRAVLMTLMTTSYEDKAATGAAYRCDLLTESNNELIEYDPNGRAGGFGDSSVIDNLVNGVPFFKSSFGAPGANVWDVRQISKIAVAEIEGVGGATNFVCAATFTSGFDGTVPDIRCMVYDANLVKVNGYLTGPLTILEGNVLVSAAFQGDGTAHSVVVFTGALDDLGPATGPERGQAAPHILRKDLIDITTGAATGQLPVNLAYYTTITGDLFKVGEKYYFPASYATSPRGTRLPPGGSSPLDALGFNYGSSINLICDTDGDIVASGGTGLVGNCYSTDWASVGTARRSVFSNISRGHATSATKVQWGSSKTNGFAQTTDRDVFDQVLFNPSLAEFETNPARNLATVEAAGSLLMAGGLLWEYSGTRTRENGFLTYPQAAQSVVVATGGGLNEGDYQVKFIYEWIDPKGQKTRSYPSDTEFFSIAAGVTTGLFVCGVYRPEWTYKKPKYGASRCSLVMYCTEAGKSVFYRAVSVEVDFDRLQQYSARTQETEIFLEFADQRLQDNEQLYSSGAVGEILGNIPPPSCTDLVLHRDRIFAAAVDGSIWYSKKLTPNTAPEFSDLQTIAIEQYRGDISAIGSVREYLIVITQEHAYLVGGDGKNAAGVGTDFSPPTIFARNSGAEPGCARTNSPVGFIYQAKGGIYQVSASMQVEWIGSPVEDTVDASKVLRAVTNDSEGEIYFSLDDATKGLLVYNYVFNTWATWEPVAGVLGGDIRGVGLIVSDTTLCFVTPNGVFLEQSAAYIDDGTTGGAGATSTYSLEVETAWLRANQFLHLARFYRILISGTYKSDHTLECSVYYNYTDGAATDTQTKAVTLANSDPYIFRKHLAQQKARAIKIKIKDILPIGGTSECYALDGIGLEFGQRAGTMVTGADKTLGG